MTTPTSGFTVYPAIDVRDGRVVRLRQGDYAQETRYPDAPLEVAARYARAGARWLHLVDLDAARRPPAAHRGIASPARSRLGAGAPRGPRARRSPGRR